MECDRTFADFLDAAIRHGRPSEAARARPRRPDRSPGGWAWMWGTASDLGFVHPRRASQRNGTLGTGGWGPESRRRETPPPRPRKPRRRLTPAQKRSLGFFQQMGEGSLHADLSHAELKAAYRRLARRLHPDMAAHGTGARAGQRAFIELREHYAVLTALVVEG